MELHSRADAEFAKRGVIYRLILKVFDAAEEGTEITFNGTGKKFDVRELPKSLYVQGHTASSTMRDVTFRLTHDSAGWDSVRFTVLWVTVNSKHTGTTATDNSARDAYHDIGCPMSHSVGAMRLFALPDLSGIGRGSEFVGDVSPSNFVPSQFSTQTKKLYLYRELLSMKSWKGPLGKDQWQAPVPGDDTSDDPMRDDKPAPNGNIYDLDVPGVPALYLPMVANEIHRYRANFRYWANFENTRCSNRVSWYSRQSYKLSWPFVESIATSAGDNTLTDTSQTWPMAAWVNGMVRIYQGPGLWVVRRITASTVNTITVSPAWDEDKKPGSGSKYRIISPISWSEHAQFTGDNENKDGSTPTSWDLQ